MVLVVAMLCSSRQSPTVMSRMVPPLAAMMTAIWRVAFVWVSAFVASASNEDSKAANPMLSRVRAISTARSLNVLAVINQRRLGRITSPQINRTKPPASMV